MSGSSSRSRPRRPDKHKSDRKSKSGRESQRHSGSIRGLSFLFVVNELVINYEDEDGSATLTTDEWYNVKPPCLARGYSGEIASRVMRWKDGQVSAANGWHWGRDLPAPGQPSAPGRVWTTLSSGSPYFADNYSIFTTFSCNPLLPFVVAEGDPSTADGPRLSPLLFFHPPSGNAMRGVSQAVTDESVMGNGPGPVKYTAGRQPSWVPSLVPPTYLTPEADAPRSAGLGGELPIVIALMAFSERGNLAAGTNRTEEIFLGRPGHHGRWHNWRWTHNYHPTGCPTAQEDPRGFMVAVFLDPENPEGSTKENIATFEWNYPIVKEWS